MKKSKLIGQIRHIAFLTPDIAIVHVTGAVQFRFQKKVPQGRQSINTNIVVKQNGQWKVRAFHNCRIKEPGLFQKLFVRQFPEQDKG